MYVLFFMCWIPSPPPLLWYTMVVCLALKIVAFFVNLLMSISVCMCTVAWLARACWCATPVVVLQMQRIIILM